MKIAAAVFLVCAIALGVISQVVADPWHAHSALTGCAIFMAFAGFAALMVWLRPRPPQQPVGTGASPRRPVPTGVHRRSR
jgi:hypothetical protein